MPSILFKTNRNNLDNVAQGRLLPNAKELISITITFSLTVLAWIFFRSGSVGQAVDFISEICSPSLFTRPEIIPYTLLVLIFIFIIIEWLGREEQYAIAKMGFRWPRAVRWGAYYAFILAIFYFSGAEQQFIYFQF